MTIIYIVRYLKNRGFDFHMRREFIRHYADWEYIDSKNKLRIAAHLFLKWLQNS